MAITAIQRKAANNTSFAAATFTSSPTAGNVLIAVGVTLSGSPSMVLTDTLGNTWTLLSTFSTASCGIQVWSTTNASTAADTVNLTSGVTATHLYIVEVSGITAALDQSNSAQSATANPTTGNVTTSNPNEFMLAIFAVNSGPFLNGAAATGWSSVLFRNAALLSSDYQEKIVTSTGTYSASRTDGDAANTDIGAIFTWSTPGSAATPTFARAATVMVMR